MSINIRTLLSKTVSAIKEKLGINSFTWGEFEAKLDEAVNGADEFSKAFFEEGVLRSEGAGGSNQTKIVVPAGITKICANRFWDVSLVASITFPNTVNLIEDHAFSACNNLRLLDFSKHTFVPTLENSSVFFNTAGIEKIRVPNALLEQWKAADVWKDYAEKIVGV